MRGIDIRRMEMIYTNGNPLTKEQSIVVSVCNAIWIANRVKRHQERVGKEWAEEKAKVRADRGNPHRMQKCSNCHKDFMAYLIPERGWSVCCSIECDYDLIVPE